MFWARTRTCKPGHVCVQVSLIKFGKIQMNQEIQEQGDERWENRMQFPCITWSFSYLRSRALSRRLCLQNMIKRSMCVCVTSYNKQDFHYKSLTNTLQHRTIVDTCANKAIPQWGKRRLITSAYLQSCSEMASGPRHEQACRFLYSEWGVRSHILEAIYIQNATCHIVSCIHNILTCNIPTQHCQTQHCHTSHGHTRSISPTFGT